MASALREGISLTRASASTARKAFWMLKPVFHLNDMGRMLNYDVRNLSSMSALERIDAFEAFMWLVYYVFENLIFLVEHCALLVEQLCYTV
jgi:hypothetical protein